LAEDKSYWYLVEIIYKRGKWRYATSTDHHPGELYLANGEKSTRKESHHSSKALGIQIQPDGKMINKCKYLISKAKKWADSIGTRRLSKYDAWKVLNCTIMKTIEYPLAATTLSCKDVDAIMHPILTTMLPKCGIQ
jgi:hypothetical protein